MKLKYYLATLIIFVLSCSPESSDNSNLQGPPNIVFLFADDFTFDAVHALGNEVIHTPNLDRLVHSGVSFTHAYNMGGWHGAICVASRSMIISGASLWPALDHQKRWADSEGKAVEST